MVAGGLLWSLENFSFFFSQARVYRLLPFSFSKIWRHFLSAVAPNGHKIIKLIKEIKLVEVVILWNSENLKWIANDISGLVRARWNPNVWIILTFHAEATEIWWVILNNGCAMTVLCLEKLSQGCKMFHTSFNYLIIFFLFFYQENISYNILKFLK